MNRLICIIGNKGGTGKTSITHMLCHGLGLLGMRSIAVLTDTYANPCPAKIGATRRLTVARRKSWKKSSPSWNPCPNGLA